MLDSVRGSKKDRGNFRSEIVYIAKPGDPIEKASYIPPSPELIPELIKNWEMYIYSQDEKDPLVQIAVAHYQFEAIHPFLDGNGRIGRLVVPLFLCDRNLLYYPVLYISEYFEKNRGEYIDALRAVDTENDWNVWIKFFLSGIKFQAVETQKSVLKPKSMVTDPRLDYVALGHIHKAQDLNEINHPPVIYPGSIERVDFGEARDGKYFVIAEVDRGRTDITWRELADIRPFHDCCLSLSAQDDITGQMTNAVPPPGAMEDAIVRLVLEYPRAWGPLIDDQAIQEYAADAFEFRLVKRPQMEERIRLPQDQIVGDMTLAELLEKFLQTSHVPEEDASALQALAVEILTGGEDVETGQEREKEETEEKEVVSVE